MFIRIIDFWRLFSVSAPSYASIDNRSARSAVIMKSRALLIRLLLPLVIIASPGWAKAAIVYDESIDGDVATETIFLSTGDNTIIGNRSWDVGSGLLDNDSFFFTIANGFEITRMSVSTSSRLGEGLFQWRITDPDESNTTVLLVHTFNTGLIHWLKTPAFPLGVNSYELASVAAGGTIGETLSLDYSWTISLAATAVPVPAAAWLFGTGLAGLIGVRRIR